METIGWIGSILLACCAILEAYVAWKYKDSPLSWTFLTMWGLGEVLITIPIIFKIQEPFLIVNYLLNILFISIIIYYKAKRRKNEI